VGHSQHGYTIDPRTGGLDHALVRGDIDGSAPRTTLGIVVRGLQRRARAHGAPITVMSCDNLLENGGTTARLVAEFVAALPAAERAELEPYLARVAFPNSMVDRIVPATTDAYRSAVAEQLGVRDEIPVPAEPFSMWAIEDEFARVPLQRPGDDRRDDHPAPAEREPRLPGPQGAARRPAQARGRDLPARPPTPAAGDRDDRRRAAQINGALQHGRITFDKPASSTSAVELTDLMVTEYRMARKRAGNGQE
jgi:hypothetical protein